MYQQQTVRVIVNGRPIKAVAGMTLSEITRGEKPCGGHGRCGKCRVVATGGLSPLTPTERELLSEQELASGVRLACLTRALDDCTVEYQQSNVQAQILSSGAATSFSLQPTFSRYGVAVDIGTTTLAARLYDVRGELLSDSTHLNPQIECGADVVSRIEYALAGGAERLTSLVRDALNGLMAELVVAARIDASEIDGVVVTGNTVMLSLLVGESVEPFSHAPFDAKRLFDEVLSARELSLGGLAPNTPVYLPRCISAFVGADTVCALSATQLCAGSTAMLADIGTNGEMALFHDGTLTVCSTAAGPAFEGVGISCGMCGSVGAIDRVSVVNGALLTHTIGDVVPKGLCASGLVDAAACLLDLEWLDESGCLEDEPLTLDGEVALTQKDIRMLQLAKSAISAGLSTLLHRRGLSDDAVASLYMAGGFGYFLNMRSAARIGLLPASLANVARAVGNAALDGAAMLLLDGRCRAESVRLAKSAKLLELASDSFFADRFMLGMAFE